MCVLVSQHELLLIPRAKPLLPCVPGTEHVSLQRAAVFMAHADTRKPVRVQTLKTITKISNGSGQIKVMGK